MTTTPPRDAESNGRAAYASSRSPPAPGKRTVSAKVASYIVGTSQDSISGGSSSSETQGGVGGKRQGRRLGAGVHEQGAECGNHRAVVGAELRRRHTKRDAGVGAPLLGKCAESAVGRDATTD